MCIYPIEISSKFKHLINANQLYQAFDFEENSNENCWIKAFAHVEKNNYTSAQKLFEKIITTDNKFKISAQVELVLLEPVKYINNKDLSKHFSNLVKKLPEQRLLARLLHALAIIMQWRRNTPQALKYLYKCRDLYRKLDIKKGLARVLDTIGNVSSVIADHQNALLYYTESLALKTTIKDTQGQAITLGNLGRLCLQLGRYQQARSFVNLDIDICDKDKNINKETKARLLNLLARIDIADGAYTSAEKYLDLAINLLDPEQKDSLFFCIKDQLDLSIKQNKNEQLQEKLIKLNELLPKNSLYHQVHLKIIENQSNSKTTLITAEQLLNDIEKLDLPELELEYRLWLSQLAKRQDDLQATQQHILLTRKIAKKYGFKRFLPQINSLMLQLDINENINEETMRTISDEISQVDDGYLIRKRLGGGGFGDVFLAHDMINDKDVAIKQFHTVNLMDHLQQKNLWNQARLEFEAVANINHPSIAKVLAIGHDNNGSPYLVQEFISGGNIIKLMLRSKDLKTALTYLIPVAQALAAIHDVGVIHRDVKPENILINQQGIAVLIDFGIALLKQGINKSNKIQGTKNYIAPEQKLSTNIDHKADLFSLGCVLYEWLSGEPVETQYTKTNKISSLFGVGKKTVCEIDKGVCGKAYDLINQLLAINPKDRPESASIVAESFQQLLE